MIGFYSPRAAWGFLSNFSDHGFHVDGVWFPTNEHFYQAHKFVGTEHFDIIRNALTPKQAAIAGRNPLRPLRSDWNDVRVNIMLEGVRYKFCSNPLLEENLLATGDELLVEISKKGSFWGCGANGKGRNWLGVVLMTVREEFR